nr:vegetative cell wall protein gp1-like [Aegilops tauschii subsp. strangulata]
MRRPRPRHCAHLAADLAPPLLRPAPAPPLRPAPQRPTRRPPVAPAVDPGPCTALLPSLAVAISQSPLLRLAAALDGAPRCAAPLCCSASLQTGVWPRRLRPPRPRPPGLVRPRSRAVAPCGSRPALPR